MDKKSVAIQGYEGSFHEIAAVGYFGPEIETVPCATFRRVARLVEAGEVDYGLIAIENSIAGSILPNYSILQSSGVKVTGEIYLRIRQNLMACEGVRLEDIEEVQSHPMAILQCTDYLDDKGWRLVETEDTALSAKVIAEKGLRNAAAIAGSLAAEKFGLTIIAPDINTIQNNHTRFLVLERSDSGHVVEGIDKASMYFKVGHNRGSLLSVLQVIENLDINMSKLQSYPIPEDPWSYLFHVDMEFDSEADYRMAIQVMERVSQQLHVYGEYKKGVNL